MEKFLNDACECKLWKKWGMKCHIVISHRKDKKYKLYIVISPRKS
jgi:hypothetical protein